MHRSPPSTARIFCTACQRRTRPADRRVGAPFQEGDNAQRDYHQQGLSLRRVRQHRRDPQPHPARPQPRQRDGGAGAGSRPQRLARLRCLPLYPPVAAAPDIPHESKAFLPAFRGIATKCLHSYARWLHLSNPANVHHRERPRPAQTDPRLGFANCVYFSALSILLNTFRSCSENSFVFALLFFLSPPVSR